MEGGTRCSRKRMEREQKDKLEQWEHQQEPVVFPQRLLHPWKGGQGGG
jgi:hypothetical protein